MKSLVYFISLVSATANAGTEITCKSANYHLLIAHDQAGKVSYANYGINHWTNDAADVEVENFYLSDRIMAASLKVDGVSNQFEISVTKNARGILEGKIFQGKFIQNATCSKKYVVTAGEHLGGVGFER